MPRAGVRSSPSRESLQQNSRQNVVNSRLRSAASRDQLSKSTSSRPQVALTPTRTRAEAPVTSRDRDVSSSTVIYTPTNQHSLRKPSHDALLKKPSKTFLHEQQVRPDSAEQIERLNDDNAFAAEDDQGNDEHSRKPRPSLSERTMETLQNIPSSPAVRKRGSSFFNPDSPMRPPSSGAPSRPTSSSQNDTSMGPPLQSVSSRPTSSAGQGQSLQPDFRASTNTFRPPPSAFQAHTPVKRPSTKSLKTPSSVRTSFAPSSTTSKLPSPGLGASVRQRSPSPSPAKPMTSTPPVKPGSKTLASRPLKPRASVNGLFRKPSMPALDQSAELDRIGFVPKKKSTTFSNTSSDGTSTTSQKSKATTLTSVSGDDQEKTPRKSSLALRDQIAKAKAAKRTAATKSVSSTSMSNEEEIPVIATGTFDFGLSEDPFNQQANQNGTKGLLRKRINAARTDGRLNIAAMGLKEIPEEVMNMYSLESIGAQDGSWAESVDLTRFVAADNEIELIHDGVFPDIDPRENMDDEDAKGNQFGGLETLDLHGNVLIALPLGLRRLDLLTTLNIVSGSGNLERTVY